MIRAIIFDMDGVLIEAKDWHYEALNRALRLFGFEVNRYEHLTSFDGLPTRRKLQMLSAAQGLPTELHEFINELKQKYTMELAHTQCRPRFANEFALARLQAEGYRLAVASNSIRASVDVMLRRAELDRYLDFTLSNQDVLLGKPDPEIYNLAISRMNLRPEECLIVEDNENGIRAARAAGAHLLEVQHVDEVNYDNLVRRIGECNAAVRAAA